MDPVNSDYFDYVILGSGAGGSTAFVEHSKNRLTALIEDGQLSADAIRNSSVKRILAEMYRDGGIRPAIGFPNIAIGEGRCVGGSTEINGGLFWRTPQNIVHEWTNLGYDFAGSQKWIAIFEELERELNVTTEVGRDGFDLDSKLLLRVANSKNWKMVPAVRMVKLCQKSNLCASGCPSGAKQSMSSTFIKRGIDDGGKLLSGWKANSISVRGQEITVDLINELGEQKKIRTKYLTLSCGAIESRRLLVKSGLIREPFGHIQFHANAKIVAKFSFDINAKNGTIFTDQLQEFMSDGFLFMPTNLNSSYLAMASSSINSETYRDLVQNIDKVGMYTAQYRVTGKLVDVQVFRRLFLLFTYLTKSDIRKIKKYLIVASEMLFEAGAEYLQLPFAGTNPVFSLEEAVLLINQTGRKHLNLSTVHIMSSLPLPTQVSAFRSHLDSDGRLKRYPRINVMDASILPSSIGESPQATIMAMVRMFSNKLFKD